MEIAIIGAGLAGLSAAIGLERRGASVHVLEASSRIGGRLRTHRPLAGIAYEAGAEWIDADHHRVRAWLEGLGTPAVAVPPTDDRVELLGDHATLSTLWPDARADEAALHEAADALCRRLIAAGWAGPLADDTDRRSLASFVEQVASSARGRAWLELRLRGDEGTDLDQVGLLGWLLGWSCYLDRAGDEPGRLALPQASDVLLERMAADLARPVSLRTPVRALEHDGEGIVVHAATWQRRFDRVILTLPPPQLRRIALPPLPPRKQQALAACGSSSALKIALAYARPWWRDRPGRGRLLSDGLVQETWVPACAEGHVLMVYVGGRRAEALRCAAEPVQLVVDALACAGEPAREGLLGGWVHDWSRRRFAGLAHVHLRQGCGADGAHLPAAAAAVGPLCFAGSWTASWHGFMEGALESAERVVDAIAGSRQDHGRES